MNLKQNGEKSDFSNKLHSALAKKNQKPKMFYKTTLYGLFLNASSRFHLLLGDFLVWLVFSLC